MRRIYLEQIGRRKNRVWLEVDAGSLDRYYWLTVRRSYRIMRTGGLDETYARWCIYDLLIAGRHAKRCAEYGVER